MSEELRDVAHRLADAERTIKNKANAAGPDRQEFRRLRAKADGVRLARMLVEQARYRPRREPHDCELPFTHSPGDRWTCPTCGRVWDVDTLARQGVTECAGLKLKPDAIGYFGGAMSEENRP